MQMHIITGATPDRMAGKRDSISTQLHMLTRQETQTIGTGCFQVDKGDIVINDRDIFNFGGDLLLRNFTGITGFIRFQDHIGYRSIAAHQHMAAGHFFLIYPVIMVPHFLDFARNNSCKAYATISVTATISQPQACTQAGLKKI
jgi:hypothetical protein